MSDRQLVLEAVQEMPETASLHEIMDESNALMRKTLTRAGKLFPDHINAARAIPETEAGCYGNDQIRFGESKK